MSNSLNTAFDKSSGRPLCPMNSDRATLPSPSASILAMIALASSVMIRLVTYSCLRHNTVTVRIGRPEDPLPCLASHVPAVFDELLGGKVAVVVGVEESEDPAVLLQLVWLCASFALGTEHGEDLEWRLFAVALLLLLLTAESFQAAATAPHPRVAFAGMVRCRRQKNVGCSRFVAQFDLLREGLGGERLTRCELLALAVGEPAGRSQGVVFVSALSTLRDKAVLKGKIVGLAIDRADRVMPCGRWRHQFPIDNIRGEVVDLRAVLNVLVEHDDGVGL